MLLTFFTAQSLAIPALEHHLAVLDEPNQALEVEEQNLLDELGYSGRQQQFTARSFSALFMCPLLL